MSRARFDQALSPTVAVSSAQLLKMAIDPSYPSTFVRWLSARLASDTAPGAARYTLAFNNEYRAETVELLWRVKIPDLIRLLGTSKADTSPKDPTVTSVFLYSKFKSMTVPDKANMDKTALEMFAERAKDIQREQRSGTVDTRRYMNSWTYSSVCCSASERWIKWTPNTSCA